MVKTTVYLTEEAKRRLTATARTRGISEAELLRTAIDKEIADTPMGFKLDNPPLSSGSVNARDDEDELRRLGFGE
jgi:hypothetical protein